MSHKGLALFADVWGFGDAMKDPEGAMKRLQDLHLYLKAYLIRVEDSKVVFGSDSIFAVIPVAKPRSPQETRLLREKIAEFITQVNLLYYESILLGLPIRGAISFGEFVADEHAVIGPAIEEAVGTEKMLEACIIGMPQSTLRSLNAFVNGPGQSELPLLSDRLLMNLPLKNGIGKGLAFAGGESAEIGKAIDYFKSVRMSLANKQWSGSARPLQQVEQTLKVLESLDSLVRRS